MMKLFTSYFFAFALIFFAANVHAATEQQSSGAESAIVWTGTFSDVRISNDLDVEYDATTQDWFSMTSFGFTAVEGTIDSIRVNVEGAGLGGGPGSKRKFSAQMIKGGTGQGDIVDAAFFVGDAIIEVNGSTDVLWNLSWVPADITATNFGCRVRDFNTTAHRLTVDHVEIFVHYTVAGAGPETFRRRRASIMLYPKEVISPEQNAFNIYYESQSQSVEK